MYRFRNAYAVAPERNHADTSYAHMSCAKCDESFLGPKREMFCALCIAPETPPEAANTTDRPAECRERLMVEGKAYPKSGCTVCGATILTGLRCRHDMSPAPSPERFVSPCPLPTPYERELLTILIEECAEVAQRATKMLRFGVEEIQPGQPLDNRQRLSDEAGDLYALLERCLEENLLDGDQMRRAQVKKVSALAKYMQTQKETPK